MPKRKRGDNHPCPRKVRPRSYILPGARVPSSVQHPVLNLCYRQVYSLGDFLQDRLPGRSRNRRKRLEKFDVDFPQYSGFLNRITIGVAADPSKETRAARLQDLITFTQKQRSSDGNSFVKSTCDLEALLDFVIWLIFRRDTTTSKRPSHLLCQGFHRSISKGHKHDVTQQWCLPGVVQTDTSTNLHILKQPQWRSVANLLGEDMETIMLDLLLDCGIFQRLGTGKDNLCQISGEPIFELQSEQEARKKSLISDKVNKPSQIKFVRNRMMYAKTSVNNQGKVQLGLKHIHALNRYNDTMDLSQDIRMMQYIFPRQYGLHNVFTSKTNSKETAQPFQDYTLREHEILSFSSLEIPRIPRRLRGGAAAVVHKLRQNHSKCAYTQLLRHYCPLVSSSLPVTTALSTESFVSSTRSEEFATQVQVLTAGSRSHTDYDPESETSLIPHAVPICHVSRFCQAVLTKILPLNTFGVGESGNNNWKCLLGSVDKFIKMQRFESTTLHEVCQPLRLKAIDWLRPTSMHESTKLSSSDRAKRLEILQELIYYVFDSILIPLIRSNFYVTETSAYRNRLFYFRHDVWKRMIEPSLATLKMAMYEPLDSRQIRHSFDPHSLSCSHMRLLPKEHGVRPITNLKRREVKVVNGKRVIGTSVNAQLGPMFSVLNFERIRQPEALASAMFSIGEIQSRLEEFKERAGDTCPETFYFAKVDIRSCFDTIPQDQLLEIVEKLILESEYKITKHVEVKRALVTGLDQPKATTTKWVTRARPTDDESPFSPSVAEHVVGSKRRTILAGTGQQRIVQIENVRKMLSDHLKNNTVKIGRKHFKQVEGIPQGSVLSSLLCSLFFGDFERRKLGFLNSSSSLLLRLVDDFLLITTDKVQAREFVKAMSEAHLEYGICINAEKSLVNFEMSLDGHKIPRLHGARNFHYCGIKIDTNNLQICKDRDTKDRHVENGLTTDRVGRVGSLFHHRICSSLKLQMHTMLFSSLLNSRQQVLRSMFECLIESGMKMHRYRSVLPKSKRPTTKILIRLCGQLVDLAFKLSHRAQSHGRFLISKSQMRWIAAAALSKVLAKKQSDYRGVIQWLRSLERQGRKSMNMSKQELEQLVSDSFQSFANHIY